MVFEPLPPGSGVSCPQQKVCRSGTLNPIVTYIT
ncbi:hypothetical protein Ae263Ps1_3187 [Pseudonocardia sp. Ae263_Ps1]|nr:hypothetical protein Ae150APs1_2131c [Pseudonocardia sp. Ae150A_Ps1]OLL86132.1 hypothetical protein Ae263Ps1_3187 [Pseudonocardia sp. Ae263_Ps1]OLL93837.1 hypothetical protein Ae356Ps1_3734c [Pseudonocardia sp. Ae356_Ps1]